VSTESTLPGVLTVPQSRRPVPVDSDELASLHRSFVRAPWGLCLRAAGVWLRTSHRRPIRLGFRSIGARPTCTHTHTHTQTYMYIYIYMYISPHLNIDPVAHGSLVSVFARAWPARIAAALRRRGAPRSFGSSPVRTTSQLRSRTCARTRRSGAGPCSTPGVPVEYPWSTPSSTP
jgi:hypothetical protein